MGGEINNGKDEQLRLFGSRINSTRQYSIAKVTPLPQRTIENNGHDDFIGSTNRQIEFHTRESEAEGMPPEQAQMHREQVEIHQRALVDYPYLSGMAEIIELPIRETPDDLVA